MTYPENVVPVNVPDGWIELRIHGVSGTPPEALLRDHPVRVAGNAMSGFYRIAASPEPPRLEAYSWGGLTSGTRRHAFWLLLLPFSLANVAGWMIPGGLSDAQRRLHDLLVRLLGLAITSLTVLFAAVLVMDLGAWRPPEPVARPSWLKSVMEGWNALPPNTRMAIAALVVGLLVAGLGLISRQTRRHYEAYQEPDVPSPRAVATDPAATASLDAAALWGTTVVGDYLGPIHTGVGLGIVGMLGGAIADHWSPPIAVWLGGLAVACGILGLVAVSIWPQLISSKLRLVPLVVGMVSGSWAFFELLEATLNPTSGPVTPPVIGFYWAFPTLFLLLAALAARGRASSADLGRGHAFALTAIALGVLTAEGAGAVFTSEWLLERGRDAYEAFDWLSIVFTVVVALALAWLLHRWDPLGPRGGTEADRSAGRFERLHVMVRDAPRLVRLCGRLLVALTVLVVIIGFFTAPRPPVGIGWVRVPPLTTSDGAALGYTNLGWLFLALPPFVLLVQALFHRLWKHLAVLAAVAAVSFAVWRSMPAAERWSPSLSFVDVARVVGLVLPALAIVILITRARSDRNLRQAVGIAWDLANYWPRWYHPWAAPPYSEIAIPALKGRIAQLQEEGHNVVVSAHSQGAVLSVPVLLQAPPAVRARLAFLSYGCLIGTVYKTLFPEHFSSEVCDEVATAVGGRWRNLYRSTDPLGDAIPRVERQTPIVSRPTGFELPLTHSDYQYNPEYQMALDAVAVPAGTA